MADESLEPWLRGSLPDVPLLVMPLFFSFTQVREELRRRGGSFTAEQVWKKPAGAAALGFHMRHIGGSVDRLLTYLEKRELSAAQLADLKEEAVAGAGFEELYRELDRALTSAEKRLVKLDLSTLDSPRFVGRRRLQVTALGLLVHIAEHTQRHLGQAVTTARLVGSGL